MRSERMKERDCRRGAKIVTIEGEGCCDVVVSDVELAEEVVVEDAFEDESLSELVDVADLRDGEEEESALTQLRKASEKFESAERETSAERAKGTAAKEKVGEPYILTGHRNKKDSCD